VYSLTDAGRAWLDAWVATLEVYRSMIDNFFSLYTGGASAGEDAAPTARPDEGDEP
jgi:DNA-binding PadR family transcriptional regulator